jgi:basic amino acid/polyamine antiporter, APA family
MASVEGAPASATTQPVVQATVGGGFARRSSGLVRDFSQLDSWMYNSLAINVVVGGALIFGLILGTYPHANLPLAFILAGLFCCFEAAAYALLTTVMPRSGGDYVFQSRVFGGAAGTIFGLTLVALVQIFYFAISGGILANIMLAPFFTLLGHNYDASWMISFGTWVQTTTGVFVCGIAVALTAALINFRGLKILAKVQRYTFWTGLAILGIFIVVLLATSHAAFVHHLNNYMATNFHIKNAYGATIAAGGARPGGFSFSQTVLAAVIAGFILIYPAWGVQQAGEVRRANSVRSNMWAMIGAEVFSVALLVLLAVLLENRAGSNFLYASGSLFISGSPHYPLPVPPFLGFLFAIAGNATIFIWLGFVMFVCWFLIFISNATLAATRGIMAASVDQVLPTWIGQVDRRVHVPLRAIVLVTIIAIGPAALYSFVHSFASYTFALYVPAIVAMGVSLLAAAVLPFTRKRLYAASPAARWAVAGIPLITICGVVFVLYAAYSTYAVLSHKELGVNGTNGLELIGGIYAVAIAIYVIARLVRRRQGIDIGQSYKELPVE